MRIFAKCHLSIGGAIPPPGSQVAAHPLPERRLGIRTTDSWFNRPVRPHNACCYSARLLSRVTLTADEERDARRELDTTRKAIEQLDAMLTRRRQRMRPM
jgi:hypothetical protein